jgi:hypothetical protein
LIPKISPENLSLFEMFGWNINKRGNPTPLLLKLFNAPG